MKGDEDGENAIEEYPIDKSEVDKLMYRVNDVLTSITSQKLHATQMKEVEAEMLRSQKLQKHFKKNPSDLAAVKHDHGVKRLHSSLKNKFSKANINDLPEYLKSSVTRNDDDGSAVVPVNELSKAEQEAIESKKRKVEMKRETLDYYTKLGLLKDGSKKQKRDPLKNM